VKEVGSNEKSNNHFPTLGWKTFDRRFRAFLVVMVIFTLGNSSDSFIILRAQDRGLSVLQILGMLMTFNAVYALLAGPLGSLSDRVGRKKLMFIGWTIYGLIYLGFALSSSGAQIWALFSVYGVYYALTEGVGKAFVADIVIQDQRGTAYGLFNAAIGLTVLPASLIAGILWQTLSPAAPFIFGAALSLLAGILLFTWVK
jgi:MFS family permease